MLLLQGRGQRAPGCLQVSVLLVPHHLSCLCLADAAMYGACTCKPRCLRMRKALVCQDACCN